MNSEEYSAWLAGLKVGDNVRVTSRRVWSDPVEVSSVTAHRIRIGKSYTREFERKSGSERGASLYSNARIRPVDDPEFARWESDQRAESERRRMRDRISSGIHHRWATNDQLRRMSAILDETDPSVQSPTPLAVPPPEGA